MDKLESAHYFSLPSQGNIYTFAPLHLVNGSNKLLVAALKREVFCFEYLENSNGVLLPTTKEVSFTYIPSGAEIISIDAFNKSENSNEFVIGITIIKNSSDLNLNTLETFLNIYSESEENREFSIESIAQNCLNVELNYIPYHLTHTELIVWKDGAIATKEMVFVLTGSDNQIHVYRENVANHIYKEIDRKEFFPEFVGPPSIVIWIDIHYYNNYSERLTVFGCECGYIKICNFSLKTSKLTYSHTTRFHNYITQVRIYPERYGDANKTKEKPQLNVVISNSILPPVFFCDVLNYGMKKCGTLPRLDMTNIFTCLDVYDVDFDGKKEILIGNSTEEIYLYKFKKEKGWCLTDLKKIGVPILGLLNMDINGDGVRELIVLTMKGVHVFQHNHTDITATLQRKAAIVCDDFIE